MSSYTYRHYPYRRPSELDGRSAAAAAQRQRIVIVFDFVAGAFVKRLATAAAAARGDLARRAGREHLGVFKHEATRLHGEAAV